MPSPLLIQTAVFIAEHKIPHQDIWMPDEMHELINIVQNIYYQI